MSQALPALPETFDWIEDSLGVALRCTPLQAVAPHLFTTRQLALSSQSDWSLLAQAIGAREVQTLTQVHGRDVIKVDRVAASRPQGDVMVSDNAAIAIAVRAADCVPILIGDPKTGAVAAVHAGWRGTAAGAATAAVAALEREFGARPADLIAAIGPSIGPCCYEVGTDLVDAFAAAGHARHLIDRWFVAPPPRRGARPALSGVEGPGLKLDMWAANRDQLMLAGLDEQNVHACGLCTASHIELFPSYRVEKDQAGRLAGIIKARA